MLIYYVEYPFHQFYKDTIFQLSFLDSTNYLQCVYYDFISRFPKEPHRLLFSSV